ncbi:transmembrane protein 171 [Hyla sarda]|uniref:transmembrane protein 171 n=1 Tax=Hyla sarda TaxID=327740 RepID=UPI0024C4676C|nr:transmembrane protein 171 [Hyla sarda]XP_056408403.1 transmembrane protein 171 [Hyla sarda]XP_056408405.1 transmembrane protein 171 [Hyla sarda]
METSHCIRHGTNPYATVSRLIFLMYLFGGVFFCAGFLLSVYVFQACKVGVQDYCTTTFKVLGPSVAVLGLASVVLAKSRSRMEATRRPLPDGITDPDHLFLFGESRQFFQCLIFGVLMVTCGVLVSILGAWIPGCKESFPDQNITGSSTNRTCGLLSLQILGPVIILIGLGFFVMGHFKKKRHRLNHEDPVNDEEQPQAPRDGQFHVTVGDTVIIFPSPPPPYFEDPLSQVAGSVGPTRDGNPPSYNSIFNMRGQNDGSNIADQECTVYTIPLPSYSNECYSNVYFASDPPPKYEEKESALPEPSTSSPNTPRDSAESPSNPVSENN